MEWDGMEERLHYTNQDYVAFGIFLIIAGWLDWLASGKYFCFGWIICIFSGLVWSGLVLQ